MQKHQIQSCCHGTVEKIVIDSDHVRLLDIFVTGASMYHATIHEAESITASSTVHER